MDKIRLACAEYDEKQVRTLMRELVPEWSGYHATAEHETMPMAKQGGSAAANELPTLH
jgi:hypothetical protein